MKCRMGHSVPIKDNIQQALGEGRAAGAEGGEERCSIPERRRHTAFVRPAFCKGAVCGMLGNCV